MPSRPPVGHLLSCVVQNLRQVWFPGVHSNIGGGYPDQGMANITLAWMISQAEAWLDFDPDYILEAFDSNKAYYKRTGQKTRPWSFGKCGVPAQLYLKY